MLSNQSLPGGCVERQPGDLSSRTCATDPAEPLMAFSEDIDPTPKHGGEFDGSSSEKRARGPVGCLIGCIGLLALFVGISIAGLWLWTLRAQQEVTRQIEMIRAKGEPASPEELGERYKVPAAESDTTELWIRACGSLKGPDYEALARELPIVGISESEIPPPGKTWEQLAAVEQFWLAQQERST